MGEGMPTGLTPGYPFLQMTTQNGMPMTPTQQPSINVHPNMLQSNYREYFLPVKIFSNFLIFFDINSKIFFKKKSKVL